MKTLLLLSLLLFTACMTEPAATEAVTDPPAEESEAAAETEAPVQTEDARTEETTEPEGTEKVQETEETTREETFTALQADLTTDEGLRAYLPGSWQFHRPHVSDTSVELTVAEDLSYVLVFTGATEAAAVESTGRLERISQPGETDAIIRFVPDEGDGSPEFYLAHRTVYDEKRVMGLYPVGEEEGAFSVLTPEGEPVPRELLFERETFETILYEPRAEAEFFAVFWGTGELPPTVWIDEVEVNETPAPAGDTYGTSPYHDYKTVSPGSLLYTVRSESAPEILGGDLIPGTIYRVRTDEKGAVEEMTPYLPE